MFGLLDGVILAVKSQKIKVCDVNSWDKIGEIWRGECLLTSC